MTIDWINRARRGGAVIRMHTENTLQKYNNAIHTFNAIFIAKEIARELNTEDQLIVDYLLIHDLPEEWVGDCPAPVKRFGNVSQEYRSLEASWHAQHVPEHFAQASMLSPVDYAIAKSADYLELVHFCVTEIELGNRTIMHVFNNAQSYVHQINNTLKSNVVINLQRAYEEKVHACGF